MFSIIKFVVVLVVVPSRSWSCNCVDVDIDVLLNFSVRPRITMSRQVHKRLDSEGRAKGHASVSLMQGSDQSPVGMIRLAALGLLVWNKLLSLASSSAIHHLVGGVVMHMLRSRGGSSIVLDCA